MSDGIDMDGALEALSAELPDEVPVESPVVESAESDQAIVEDNQGEPESFTGFDPSLLPEDMQAVYRSMQGDYTRKTQEIAELRRQYETLSESGVDPNDAVEAVHLWQRMYNDPEFATQIAQGLQNRLEEMGYAQTQQPEETQNTNNSYEGLPPQLARELEEMRSFREEMVQHQAQQEMIAELEAIENTIRTTNPQYSDEDIESIYNLAYAHNGDLMAAQEQYAAIQQRMLGSYLQSKSVPHGATPAPTAPSTVPNREFNNLDDAHKAAMEALRNIS